jgi:hypothetical protein
MLYRRLLTRNARLTETKVRCAFIAALMRIA